MPRVRVGRDKRAEDGGAKKHRVQREHLLFLAFIAPNFLLLGVFTYWPMIYQGYLSLTRWNMLAPRKTFVGLDNYASMFGGVEFWGVLFKTFYFMGTVVLGSVALGLAIAILLNQRLRGRNFVRSVVFAPVILSGAAVGLVWAYIFDPNYGLMRTFLEPIGISSPDWLGSTEYAMPAIIIVYLWKSLGFSVVIYLAGLQNISKDLYEAARIDGASKWVLFRHITLPQLSPVTFFVVLTTIINSFQAFDIIAVMTGGGPAGATTTLIWYIYQEAFVAFRAGTAAAAAIVMFLLLLVIAVFQIRYSQRGVHYK
ncbi:MAG: Glycerol-3-phosphate ABC transporter, permease protein UgpA [uncultured Rubrobacteraceae bacterium]|uniref:Glycerol-3-phosphate ABC transporter, permease protein UgpA n=1 Tax=uncultured Rubrobacteraceae bacterium TaxID=349277 RepID=A0A6J4Q666_9ACTN|nr:MAG: Glycerol-3-phosphate ABC transporter, permease protein UgpA [uncultured Rubrobacteraceae bacterium]